MYLSWLWTGEHKRVPVPSLNMLNIARVRKNQNYVQLAQRIVSIRKNLELLYNWHTILIILYVFRPLFSCYCLLYESVSNLLQIWIRLFAFSRALVGTVLYKNAMIALFWYRYRMSFPYILCAGPEQNCLIRLFKSFPDSNPSRYEYGSGSDPKSRPSLGILDPAGNNSRSGRIRRTTASEGRIRKYGSVENTFSGKK